MAFNTNVAEAEKLFQTPSFPHFAPLLDDCQDYARLSGCRFRKTSFDGIPTGADSQLRCIGPERARDSGPRLASKLRAAAAVKNFSDRLLTGDAELMEEFNRAYQIVMVESVRNAMMSMFQALDMFPPASSPSSVLEDDCTYEDTSAPLDEIAQRLYNDQVRRISDSTGCLEHRAKAASFIVDFTSGIGIPLPQPPETQQHMLKELAERVAAIETQQGSHARDVFLKGLGVGAAADMIRASAGNFWAEHGGAVIWGAAGALAFGLGGAILGVAAKRFIDRRKKREEEDS